MIVTETQSKYCMYIVQIRVFMCFILHRCITNAYGMTSEAVETLHSTNIKHTIIKDYENYKNSITFSE